MEGPGGFYPVTNVHFAALFAGVRADFVDVDEFGNYILPDGDLKSSKVESCHHIYSSLYSTAFTT
jgi:hypothetical protein